MRCRKKMVASNTTCDDESEYVARLLMSYDVYANLFNSDTTSDDETEIKKSKKSVLFETPPASTPSITTGKGGRRKSKSAPTGPRLNQFTSINLDIGDAEIARLVGMLPDLMIVAQPSMQSSCRFRRAA